MAQLWGGRFEKGNDRLVEEFHSSLSFDRRLYSQDIRGSMAHARMLGRVGVITWDEAAQIVSGLEAVLADIEAGRVEFSPAVEDIHSLVEQELIKKIGDLGKKLHTGRSRNDQVALDVRMYIKEEIEEIEGLLRGLRLTLVDLAEEHVETVMPGYTHLQRAQPVTYAHHLLAYFEMFGRDLGRLYDCFYRIDVMPLGAGALAGTVFPLDRESVAAELGFGRISENSLDAVSDRDFAIEFCAAASLIMMHLSRFCEEIILWSTSEFAFIEVDDAYATGSSIMPQKKNPDMAELTRGKAGRVFGDLQTLLTLMKGLPLAYNKDMQEDKEALFDAVDTVKKCLLVFKPMIRTIRVRKDRMDRAVRSGFTNATDLADYLVRKGVPFREAHEIVGKAVLYAIEQEKDLEAISLDEYRGFSASIEADVYAAISIENSLTARRLYGGPAPEAVREAIARARHTLGE
ncbi:MAG: argininosuccinate lyase [Eubacteriales bacterium]|jgi:argininosuccinate lyase|nr:argininosuccinate lyase [Bacillota bacterium]MBV1728229.1 argininosuccinate lyase [Desulforudis sp.]MDQ7789280.1 argininosuccinate lyase [Clostridia bacterium]MDZ4043401.1 argininosuccinate lyase [Eubacteriales bacterium]MBU4532379.1 argininosuccinate lyase [Bacillota bacterium]